MQKNNLIIQHWSGDLPKWAFLAEESIKKYCENIDCSYQRISDSNFIDIKINKNIKQTMSLQKMNILSDRWDEYDDVCMLDMDMVATKKCENIFKYTGIGRLHKKSMQSKNSSKNGKLWPNLYHQGLPMFFGNCIKFTKKERKELRSAIDKEEIFNSFSEQGVPPNDEILMHHLFYKTGIISSKEVLELPHDRFCDLPEESHSEASLLHFCGPRKNSIIHYKDRLI